MTGSHHASGARNDGPGLFDQARAAISPQELAEREGVVLKRAGQEMRGSCPICGAGQGSKSVFAVKADRWRCYACNERGGDVVDLERELRGGDGVEAARRLVGREAYTGPVRARPVREAKPAGPSVSDRVALELWRDARPFTGSLAERYLRRRGIAADVLALASPNLRFHPLAKHHWDPRAGDWVKAPAMVVQVVVAGPDGKPVPTGGAHATYLDRATAGKAEICDADGVLMPAKRMWGPQNAPDGRPGGAWLIGPSGIGALAVSEGIETGLSVVTLAERDRRPLRAVAALSLNRLQGGWMRDDEGCVDLADIQPDPGTPAFTWPAPAVNPWGRVWVAVDRDMKDLRVRSRTGRGKPCWFSLAGEDRAQICARLATRAWLATGASHVRALQPPPGKDFNDELRRVLALESAR